LLLHVFYVESHTEKERERERNSSILAEEFLISEKILMLAVEF